MLLALDTLVDDDVRATRSQCDSSRQTADSTTGDTDTPTCQPHVVPNLSVVTTANQAVIDANVIRDRDRNRTRDTRKLAATAASRVRHARC